MDDGNLFPGQGGAHGSPHGRRGFSFSIAGKDINEAGIFGSGLGGQTSLYHKRNSILSIDSRFGSLLLWSGTASTNIFRASR